VTFVTEGIDVGDESGTHLLAGNGEGLGVYAFSKDGSIILQHKGERFGTAGDYGIHLGSFLSARYHGKGHQARCADNEDSFHIGNFRSLFAD
jgi:hypothetical protein